MAAVVKIILRTRLGINAQLRNHVKLNAQGCIGRPLHLVAPHIFTVAIHQGLVFHIYCPFTSYIDIGMQTAETPDLIGKSYRNTYIVERLVDNHLTGAILISEIRTGLCIDNARGKRETWKKWHTYLQTHRDGEMMLGVDKRLLVVELDDHKLQCIVDSRSHHGVAHHPRARRLAVAVTARNAILGIEFHRPALGSGRLGCNNLWIGHRKGHRTDRLSRLTARQSSMLFLMRF